MLILLHIIQNLISIVVPKLLDILIVAIYLLYV